jgi:hypothetical protein
MEVFTLFTEQFGTECFELCFVESQQRSMQHGRHPFRQARRL